MTRQHIAPPAPPSANPPVTVRTLTPADLPWLNLRSHPRLDEAEATALVIQCPGLSKWVPGTGEFALVTPWRHRREIPTVSTLWAFRYEEELIGAVTAAAEASGHAGLVLMDAYEARRPAFYAKTGLELLEEIISYEHAQPERFLATLTDYRQRFELIDWRRPDLVEPLLALDHAAFPWLWWNSEEEFGSYLRMPNVELWAGWQGDEIVSYIGMTHFHRWGHLDRIAIRPDVQGQGLGREALHFAVRRMVGRGAHRVALSTQGANGRSRGLYESVGFRQTPEHDYGVYGVMFASGRALMSQEG